MCSDPHPLVIFLFAGATLIILYKGRKGRLVQVLQRDGGLYYIASASIGLIVAITRTPAIVAVGALDPSPISMFVNVSQYVGIPILAQRLMINIRKTDYVGSRPIASKLLFAPPTPGSEDDEDPNQGNQHHFEVDTENSYVRRSGGDSPATRPSTRNA
ncbi:hypothetical protein NMY22_g4460 [Coprinellus aureogranulatus]|nr:hypothetical protein NMY22_g4460 [Coprinellus aureogranulatus]